MSKNRNGSVAGLDDESKTPEHITGADLLTDEDTAELPVLDPANFENTSASLAEPEREIPDSRAADWVRHVGDELERLRARWNVLDEELAEAKDRIASLHSEIQGKDARIAELTGELESAHRDAVTLEATVAERQQSIALLEQSAAERDGQLMAAVRSAAVAEDRVKAFAERLEAANQEAAVLRDALQDERSQAAELRAEKKTIGATNGTLREKLQTLETYIEGRRERWSEQDALLKSHAATISHLEAELAASAARADERDANREALEARIREYEIEAGKLEGRFQERETAHKEIYESLQERIAEVEKLKEQLAQQGARAAEALADTAMHCDKLDALEISLNERDQSIRRLEADLDKISAINGHMDEQQRTDRAVIAELHEKAASLQVQRDELAAALDAARSGTDVLTDKLDAREQSIAELEKRIEAQQAQIAALETELESRAEVIAGFDAHAEQLDRLSRELTAMHGTPPDTQDAFEINAILGAEDAPDHIETQADLSDRSLPRQRHPERAAGARLLADLELDPSSGRHHVLVRLTDDNDDSAVHVLSKPVTTVGRSDENDICIADRIVSRTHARLRLDDSRVTIEDASSKNGFSVNGRKVERAVLRSGDVISFGEHEFRFVELDLPALTH